MSTRNDIAHSSDALAHALDIEDMDAAVVHELKNSLTAVKALVQLGRLKDALVNLVTNGIEATPPGPRCHGSGCRCSQGLQADARRPQHHARPETSIEHPPGAGRHASRPHIAGQRSDLNAARSSAVKSCGCSQAAK